MEAIFFTGLSLAIVAALYFKAAQRRRLRAVILRRLGLETDKAAKIYKGIGGL